MAKCGIEVTETVFIYLFIYYYFFNLFFDNGNSFDKQHSNNEIETFVCYRPQQMSQFQPCLSLKRKIVMQK